MTTSRWLETYEGGSPSLWAKRIKLSIDSTNVDTDLIDFPVMINVASGTGINDEDITSVIDDLTSSGVGNRYKMAVTSEDGITQLPVEIEHWDSLNKKATLWTKVPTVASGTNTNLYLYYDNTKSDNTAYIGDTGDSPAQSVWDSDFVGVWHMAQNPDPENVNSIPQSPTGAGTRINNTGMPHSAYHTDLGLYPYNASDGSASTLWQTNQKVNWWKVDLGTTYAINALQLGGYLTSHNKMVKDFVLYGSLNNSDWDLLYTGQAAYDTALQTFLFENATEYRYWRLNTSSNWGNVKMAIAIINLSIGDVPDNIAVDCIKDSTSIESVGSSHGSMLSEDLIDGKPGKALDFDGTDDYINCGYNSAHDITDTLTLECSFNPTVTLDSGLTDYPGLISRQFDPTDTQDTYALLINTDGKLFLGSAGGNIQSTKASWQSGIDFYVAGTYNSSGLVGDLFVDGVKETLTFDSYDTMAGGTNNLVIGKHRDTSDFMNASISETRVSKIVRSDAWIKTTYYSNYDNLLIVTPELIPVLIYRGTVLVDTFPKARTVYLYRRGTGELVGTAVSDPTTGYFEITSSYQELHFVNILPEISDGFNIIVRDKLDPGV